MAAPVPGGDRHSRPACSCPVLTVLALVRISSAGVLGRIWPAKLEVGWRAGTGAPGAVGASPRGQASELPQLRRCGSRPGTGCAYGRAGETRRRTKCASALAAQAQIGGPAAHPEKAAAAVGRRRQERVRGAGHGAARSLGGGKTGAQREQGRGEVLRDGFVPLAHNQSSRALPLASDGAHLRLLHCKQRQGDTRDTRGARVEGEGRGRAVPGEADGEHTAVLCGGGVLRLETRWVSWRRAPLHAPISAPTRFCTGRWWWRGGRRVGRSCTGRLSTPAPPSSCPPLTLSSSHPPLPFLLPPTRQGLGTCVESRKQYVRTKNGENPNPNLNITPGSVGTTGESSECRVWHNKPSPLPSS